MTKNFITKNVIIKSIVELAKHVTVDPVGLFI